MVPRAAFYKVTLRPVNAPFGQDEAGPAEPRGR